MRGKLRIEKEAEEKKEWDLVGASSGQECKRQQTLGMKTETKRGNEIHRWMQWETLRMVFSYMFFFRLGCGFPTAVSAVVEYIETGGGGGGGDVIFLRGEGPAKLLSFLFFYYLLQMPPVTASYMDPNRECDTAEIQVPPPNQIKSPET